MLNYQSENFKSLNELKEIAPSIFTKNGSSNTSDKYTHIPTDTVIKDLSDKNAYRITLKYLIKENFSSGKICCISNCFSSTSSSTTES